jgi:hypothetical protein
MDRALVPDKPCWSVPPWQGRRRRNRADDQVLVVADLLDGGEQVGEVDLAMPQRQECERLAPQVFGMHMAQPVGVAMNQCCWVAAACGKMSGIRAKPDPGPARDLLELTRVCTTVVRCG